MSTVRIHLKSVQCDKGSGLRLSTKLRFQPQLSTYPANAVNKNAHSSMSVAHLIEKTIHRCSDERCSTNGKCCVSVYKNIRVQIFAHIVLTRSVTNFVGNANNRNDVQRFMNGKAEYDGALCRITLYAQVYGIHVWPERLGRSRQYSIEKTTYEHRAIGLAWYTQMRVRVLDHSPNEHHPPSFVVLCPFIVISLARWVAQMWHKYMYFRCERGTTQSTSHKSSAYPNTFRHFRTRRDIPRRVLCVYLFIAFKYITHSTCQVHTGHA